MSLLKHYKQSTNPSLRAVGLGVVSTLPALLLNEEGDTQKWRIYPNAKEKNHTSLLVLAK